MVSTSQWPVMNVRFVGPQRRGMASNAFVPDVSGSPASERDGIERLRSFVMNKAENTLVVTGAGVSTESGIPCYRGDTGSYNHGHVPMMHNEFVGSLRKRKRYWTRSIVGWKYFDRREPNVNHEILATLERDGYVSGIVTQNVDQLHSRAGSKNVLELHGRNDVVRCVRCAKTESRSSYQNRILDRNREWVDRHLKDYVLDGHDVDGEIDLSRVRADGDAHISDGNLDGFRVPLCERCGSDVVMPTVVFFGGAIASEVKDRAMSMIRRADNVLVLGTSCTVYSAFNLVRSAANLNKPIAAVNIGEMRVDPHLSLKIEAVCSDVLREIVR